VTADLAEAVAGLLAPGRFPAGLVFFVPLIAISLWLTASAG
jgi:hypothetical protein